MTSNTFSLFCHRIIVCLSTQLTACLLACLQVPFIYQPDTYTVVQWQWPELVIFFGFVNQLLGTLACICQPDC